MQAIDRATIEDVGIPRLLLMEHAGLAIARQVLRLLTEASPSVLICCGTGFNGGDGLAAARHLHRQGRAVRVILLGTAARLRDEPAIYARIARQLGIPLQELARGGALDGLVPPLSSHGVIVDALLGIGMRGPVREPARSLIGLINAAGRPVVSADIPSGLNGDSGLVEGAAVRATVTVAFGCVKQGCLRGEGPAHTGELVVEDLTIPPALLEAVA
jgi:NAD(P)H-hydrate epimerase